MKDLKIERYSSADEREWNDFVNQSRNATFLFNRGFMDYHSDRFIDHSLIARDGGKIVALLPANITSDEEGRVLHSHSGLTYGSWLLGPRHPDASEMLTIFNLTKEYALRNGIEALDYKPIPFIYSGMPSQEDLYALFRYGAGLTERNISVAINLSENPGLNTQQKRNLKRALGVESIIEESDNVELFHSLLSECLAERHGVKPVHTSEELRLLKERFPQNIRIFMLTVGGTPQAGVCIFDCGPTIHAQYICSTPTARKEGLLTCLFDYLINSQLFPHAQYFDFGICNENHGLFLNEGLYRQKSSLGGSAVVYERYLLSFSD